MDQVAGIAQSPETHNAVIPDARQRRDVSLEGQKDKNRKEEANHGSSVSDQLDVRFRLAEGCRCSIIRLKYFTFEKSFPRKKKTEKIRSLAFRFPTLRKYFEMNFRY